MSLRMRRLRVRRLLGFDFMCFEGMLTVVFVESSWLPYVIA